MLLCSLTTMQNMMILVQLKKLSNFQLKIKERENKASLACYKALKCSVYARVDMMVKEGIPYVMEVNTLPGMTQSSLLPKSAEAAELIIANY